MMRLTSNNYIISRWAGGQSVQLAIHPAHANYSNQDFLWRISTATVEVDESFFTSLPDYDRLICPLEGEMLLCHNDDKPIVVLPFQPHGFDGKMRTHAQGRCTDFNLMLRKGKVRGSMRGLKNLSKGSYILASTPLSEMETMLVYCFKGQGVLHTSHQSLEFSYNESILIQGNTESIVRLSCLNHSSFMVVEVQVL